MSSTRRAADNSDFHQDRFASSPEYERGLSGLLVAKRISVLDEKPDRELIWFLHYLSHRPGGLGAVVTELIERYGNLIGTRAMRGAGDSESRNFCATEVRRIRAELPEELLAKFPLRGDKASDLLSPALRRIHRQAEAVKSLGLITFAQPTIDRRPSREFPDSYPAAMFRKICIEAALKPDGKMSALERRLFEVCLDPALGLNSAAPWYFADLVDALRQFHLDSSREKESRTVVTSLGRTVCEALEFTRETRRMSLVQGHARTGKSFCAKAWCEQRPGVSRFVEVPPGNDDAGFFRAMARGLGLGNFLQYKATEIRERVQSVLLSGDLVLVLDEAQRLFPQRNLRQASPTRIDWVMALANQGVPIAMISTPQFVIAQKVVEKNGWNSAQLTGRIYYFKNLPRQLENGDLFAVARALLPDIAQDDCEKSWRDMAVYAEVSSRCLAAIDAVAVAARFNAGKEGRKSVTHQDVLKAIRESIGPSDAKLRQALGEVRPLPESHQNSDGQNRVKRSENRNSLAASARRQTVPVPDLVG